MCPSRRIFGINGPYFRVMANNRRYIRRNLSLTVNSKKRKLRYKLSSATVENKTFKNAVLFKRFTMVETLKEEMDRNIQ